jgi:hypothetical protein
MAALDRAIAQDDSRRLRDAVEKLLDLAAAGEPWAIQMLAEKLDGRTPQAVSVDQSVSITHEHVEVPRVVERVQRLLSHRVDGDLPGAVLQ